MPRSGALDPIRRGRRESSPPCRPSGVAPPDHATTSDVTLRTTNGTSPSLAGSPTAGASRVDAERCRDANPHRRPTNRTEGTRRLFPLGGAAAGREWCLGAVRGRAGRRGLAAAAAATRRPGEARSRLGVRVPRTAGGCRQCNRSFDIPASASRAPGRISTAGRPRFANPVDTAAARHQCRPGRTTSRAHRETTRSGPGGQVRRFTRAPPTRAVGQAFPERRCDATRSDVASEALDGAAGG